MGKGKLISHRGFWKELEEQNTEEAILKAFSEGFNVEIDIRLNIEGKLVTGHDIAQEFNWTKILSCPDRKMIAFHVKEKNLASKLWNLIGKMDYLDYIIFGVEEDEIQTYTGLFGTENIAFEYNAGDDFEKVFNCRNKIIWLAELDSTFSKKELLLLKSLDKTLYLVMQDCHKGDMILFGVRLTMYQDGLIDGICTDHPAIIANYKT